MTKVSVPLVSRTLQLRTKCLFLAISVFSRGGFLSFSLCALCNHGPPFRLYLTLCLPRHSIMLPLAKHDTKRYLTQVKSTLQVHQLKSTQSVHFPAGSEFCGATPLPPNSTTGSGNAAPESLVTPVVCGRIERMTPLGLVRAIT